MIFIIDSYEDEDFKYGKLGFAKSIYEAMYKYALKYFLELAEQNGFSREVHRYGEEVWRFIYFNFCFIVRGVDDYTTE